MNSEKKQNNTGDLGNSGSTAEENHNECDPYLGPAEHLYDELRWLNRILAAQVIQLRNVNFYEQLKDFRDLFIADEEIDALLSEGIFEANNKSQRQKKSIQSLLKQVLLEVKVPQFQQFHLHQYLRQQDENSH